jgi:hypothetical protein
MEWCVVGEKKNISIHSYRRQLDRLPSDTEKGNFKLYKKEHVMILYLQHGSGGRINEVWWIAHWLRIRLFASFNLT